MCDPTSNIQLEAIKGTCGTFSVGARRWTPVACGFVAIVLATVDFLNPVTIVKNSESGPDVSRRAQTPTTTRARYVIRRVSSL